MHPPRWIVRLTFLSFVLSSWPIAAAAEQGPSALELRKLSLEELGNLAVTSVSRAEERLSGAAAAIAVITNEELRRSGATTVPEALRLVPGLHVARQTSNIWAVSARGFGSTNSEKLLVLTDTRSVYTPLFSGVFWDVQDLLLEDVARIEVIRGPGATLWGSNAVNGVINITTKSARETQGVHLSVAGGSEERAAVSARYGGRVGAAYYRVFGKFTDRGATFVSDTPHRDDWQLGRGGVRVDWDTTTNDTVMLLGAVYGGDVGRLSPSISLAARPSPAGPLRVDVSGGHLLGRWTRRFSAESELQARVYYDRTHRDDPSFVDDLDTFDADVQHRVTVPGRQEITWGANFRFMANRNLGRGVFALDPPESKEQVYSGFAQHQIQLGDAIRLTTGTKVERNDFSGGELQPSARVAWRLQPAHTLWGSASRAVRIPTRLERDVAIDATDPAGNPVVRLLGNPAFAAERLLAFEAGYRWQSTASFLLDLAAYRNLYRGLASLEPRPPFASGGRLIVPIVNENLTSGHAEGIEAALTVAPRPWARLSATSNTSWLDLTAHGLDLNRGVSLEGATPRHQFGLRSMLDVGARVDVDAELRHSTAIRRLPAITTGEGIPAYAELNVRVAWRPTPALEAAIVGQNLLHDHHPEFGSLAMRGEIERGVYASLTWRR